MGWGIIGSIEALVIRCLFSLIVMLTKKLAAAREVGGAMPIGEQPEMSNTHESARHDVHQESPQELSGVQRHFAWPVVVGIVLPKERHIAIVHRNQASVGNRDLVRVAGQLLENLLRSAERLFRVHNPLVTDRTVK